MATLLGQTVTVDVDDRRRAAVRVGLWVLLVVSVLLAVWGTPRSASQNDLARAIKAGDVRAVQPYDSRYGLELTGISLTISTAADQPTVVWQDSRGLLHRTVLLALPGTDPDEATLAVDVPATIRATAATAGVAPPAIDQGFGWLSLAAVPLGLLTLVLLGLLVLGPQPRRLTKWGMFWVLWIPLGVGMGWWLARDTPFAPVTNRAAQPAPGEKGLLPNGIRRTGGGVAFLAAWGVSILIGIALAIVLGITGSTNGPSSPTETWTLVSGPEQPFGP